MSSSTTRKRKHVSNYRPHLPQEHDPVLFIQAHEADVISGHQAIQAAQSLEVETLPSNSRRTGDALIRWSVPGSLEVGEDGVAIRREGEEVWVDRYDARLLLDALPHVTASVSSSSTIPARLSPTGWSDLPSDTEDTFFFLPEEAEDYRRDKKRRVIANLREERLRALREEREEEEDGKDEDAWGGSDEEPDDQQKELMRRTATHLLSSPNAAQLEMRILANHGADPRFAFLKGRWSRVWRTLKLHIRADMETEQAKATAGALGGLAGYGDSDEDSNAKADGDEKEVENDNKTAEDAPSRVAELGDSEDAVKAARRARAKEWAEKRRVTKGGDDSA